MGAKGNSGAAAPSAEIKKSTAAMINPRLRPMCVLTQPPINPPMMQPIERAGNHKAQQRIGGVGAQIPRVNKIGLQAAHRPGDDGGVIAEQQSAQRGDEGEQNDVAIQGS